VHYKKDYAKSVGVLFNWDDDTPTEVIITKRHDVAEYVPGEFYKREMPCVLDLIEKVALEKLDAVLVDGHVYIDNAFGHGLGGYVYEALNRAVPVIGVAKRAFHANDKTNRAVLRGNSKNPLYVSAIGADLDTAAQAVKNMHGDFRMPTLLQVLDTETKKDD